MTPDTLGTVTCGQCGAPMRPGAKFCRTCGAAAPTAAAGPVACLQCGHINPVDSKFCRNCGTTLPAQATPLAHAAGADITQPMPLTSRGAGLSSGPPTPDPPPPLPPPASSAGTRTGPSTMIIAVIAVLVAAGGAGAALAIVATGKSGHASSTGSRSAHSTTVIVGNAVSSGTSPDTAASTSATNGGQTTPPATSATTGDTQATGTVANAVPSSASGPDETIREHLEDLQNGDYQGAFELMSARYRGENPSWPSVRGAADPTIHIVTVGSPDYRSGTAHVYVDFYAQDAHPTAGSDTYCREFKGTVELISEEGAWRYSPYGDNLRSQLQPNSDCQS